MFNTRSRRKKGRKSSATKVVVVPDGRTELSIPNPTGLNSSGVIESVMHLRFKCSTATTSSISWANILDTVIMATTSTQAADVFYSVRLHSLEVWLPPSVGGVATSVDCGIAFDSPSQGDQKLWIVSAGPTGGYMKCKPSNRSLDGWTWQDSSSVTAFTFNNCPVGATFRLNVTFRSRMGAGSAQLAAQAGSGMTVGTLYLRGLDGLAAASTKFYPLPESYAA